MELKGVLDGLFQRFKSLNRIVADYSFTHPPDPDATRSLPASYSIALDRGASKILSVLTLKDSKATTTYSKYFEATRSHVWSTDGEAAHWDLRPHWEEMERRLSDARATLMRLLPRPPEIEPDVKMTQPAIAIMLAGQPGKDEQATLRMLLGFTSDPNPPSWLREAAGDDKVAVGKTESDVIFVLPRTRKRIIVDAKTGWLKELEVEDFDGRKRAMRLTRLDLPASFPEVKLPSNSRDQLPPSQQLHSAVMAQASALYELAGEIALQWDAIPDKVRREDIPKAVSRTCALVADLIDATLAKGFADHKIESWMNAGLTLADLRADTEGFARSYARECLAMISDDERDRGKVARELHRQILEKTEIAAEERMASFRKMVEQALAPDAVEPLRRSPPGSDLKRYFLEALDRVRKL